MKGRMKICVLYMLSPHKKEVLEKTFTVESLGICLANKGYKVLLKDTDSQGSLTTSLGYTEPDDLEITIYTIMAN